MEHKRVGIDTPSIRARHDAGFELGFLGGGIEAHEQIAFFDHRAGFEGGPIAGGPPDWPPAADLTPGGAMTRYDTAEKFIAMMRTGKRPDGSEVNKAMPFMSLRNFNDTDLHALYLYFKSLPRRQ